MTDQEEKYMTKIEAHEELYYNALYQVLTIIRKGEYELKKEYIRTLLEKTLNA